MHLTMILYHCTNCLDTGTILTEGLKPSGNGQPNEGLEPRDAVWLTTSRDPSDWALEIPLAMIELVIPSRDRKLVKWSKWVRRHKPELEDMLLCHCNCGRDHRPAFKLHYCYFGIVAPESFRAFYRVNKDVTAYELAWENDAEA